MAGYEAISAKRSNIPTNGSCSLLVDAGESYTINCFFADRAYLEVWSAPPQKRTEFCDDFDHQGARLVLGGRSSELHREPPFVNYLRLGRGGRRVRISDY